MTTTDKRTDYRKMFEHTYCLIDDIEPQFEVVEISAHGFSFACDRADERFRVSAPLRDIAILDSDSQEIIHAEGIIRHRSDFDARRDRVGVSFERKRFQNMTSGRVRLPRRRPSIDLAARLIDGSVSASGTVVDYNIRSARISVQEESQLPLGATIRIAIRAGNRTLYDGAAKLIRVEEELRELVVEFLDNLLELRSITLIEKALFAKGIVDEKRKELDAFSSVSLEFKGLVADWRMYMEMVEDVLDREEAKGFLVDSDEERSYLEELLPAFSAHMREFIVRLNRIAPTIDPEHVESCKLLLHQRLERFVRRSPLASSMSDRLHGYLGDYETVKYFFGNAFLGSTLFGKLMNGFIMSLEPVVAHVYRIEYLKREILARYRSSENGIRILSLGSGPAEEILRFLAEQRHFDKPIHFTLVDMDAHGLADFYERAQYRATGMVEIELVNFNIINILVGKRLDLQPESYDITYSAGLFDYFKDRFCRKFVDLLVGLTAPGGNFYFTNVHSRNFARYVMDFALGWEIIHRDEEQTLSLAPPDYPNEEVTDVTGTNIFVKGTKVEADERDGSGPVVLEIASAGKG